MQLMCLDSVEMERSSAPTLPILMMLSTALLVRPGTTLVNVTYSADPFVLAGLTTLMKDLDWTLKSMCPRSLIGPSLLASGVHPYFKL